MSNKRVILRIQLTPSAKTALQRVCRQRGMSQVAVLSRLVSWFGAQDEIVQSGVLETLSPENVAALAKILLERMSRENKKSPRARRRPPAANRQK
jgi:hypothetical protein